MLYAIIWLPSVIMVIVARYQTKYMTLTSFAHHKYSYAHHDTSFIEARKPDERYNF